MMTISTPSWLEFNSSAYNDATILSNISYIDSEDIIRHLLAKFQGKTNYLLIVLYVFVMALAVTANILVIAVVFKYHYMRRYVEIIRFLSNSLIAIRLKVDPLLCNS